ncbi:hypothetical protein J4G43_021715 [Bradyrhizobium barranii subsp. barranii]|uniref:Uncharacterized protein n=1 Tax=Bradyrhizobium barranii subsp. barranii TaxID=2823807 RepID=A0A939M5X6_9BRAD|nr:hypothetical protein [Bradyrhizobium barranii]UEM17887.1 hypothetical protein J4G43_021715 [Bradyrhizobium barranii subsp. barranii]
MVDVANVEDPDAVQLPNVGDQQLTQLTQPGAGIDGDQGDPIAPVSDGNIAGFALNPITKACPEQGRAEDRLKLLLGERPIFAPLVDRQIHSAHDVVVKSYG